MKILIVDDHTLFREGLSYVLENLAHAITTIEANNYQEAVNRLELEPDIDLVLLDLALPGENGFTLLDFCRNQFPTISVVVLSATKQQSDLMQAIKGGAMGFIPKDASSKTMLSALRSIMQGDIYFPASISEQPTAENQNTSDAFTPRQKEVIIKMMQGLSNKKIALEMDIAEATIKMHVTAIFKHLGVNNRTEATLAAQKLGVF
ncbi:response regulator transcription factor [Paraglaciecola sp. L3A3]|uniref:response regulator n=1 Tax=Paraglaciecola sp. L3A3 TaxID=2686358 RepID=UPI00131A9755|nr:response regulator transcription factor [Paraglaciecola sp. L3A3]